MIEATLAIIIVVFGLYTYRVGKQAGGYVQFWRQILSHGPCRQVTIDLYIATTLLCIWMVFDAIEVGISLVWVAVYITIALFMASFGPLLYLLHRFLLI